MGTEAKRSVRTPTPANCPASDPLGTPRIVPRVQTGSASRRGQARAHPALRRRDALGTEPSGALGRLVRGLREARDLAGGGLLRDGALAGGLRDRNGGDAHGVRGLLRVLRRDRFAGALELGANGGLDATVAHGALDSLAVALFGGRMIGHGLASKFRRGAQSKGMT